MSITEQIYDLKHSGKKGIAVLIDPDNTTPGQCEALCQRLAGFSVDFLLVGGSLLINNYIDELIPEIKRNTDIPVILFPGSIYQVHQDADAILFLSLISGRNPEMLIGKHVIAAPIVKKSGLEVIPTGYMLIETGNARAVNYMSNTVPIPYDKPEIAVCTALAGALLGLKLIYMDGGSGAERTISADMISKVSDSIDVPLIVGGGIRKVEDANEMFQAGADVVVVGNAIEEGNGDHLLSGISELISTQR